MLRLLTNEEIDILENNGCFAEDWSRIKVGNGFQPENVQRTKFYGDIRLMGNSSQLLVDGNIPMNCGVYDSVLNNCEIGKDVLIERVSLLSNYIISPHTIIRNVQKLAIEGETSFGNGVEVSVMDETGGRKIPIYNRLSAVLAYIAVFYRYKPEIINVIQHMVADYVASINTRQGFVGEGTIIEGCGNLINIRVGENAELMQVTHLKNCSINSASYAPVKIMNGVVANDFIVACGSTIANNVRIERCFIGEACKITNGFTAHDSLIFANSQLENGEACAIFAGPYTVSMHKSTLLIGGLFSFFNAGSGSNQSNHAYKLGPIHQGVTERGVKLASGSYILWPAKIGAFSMVMGSHYSHPDTSNFPFSYLIEKHGEVYLIPGAALRSVGTHRDVRKWPSRDLRKSTEPLDAISFEWLSPYTIGSSLVARDTLIEIRDNESVVDGYYDVGGVRIKESALHKGIELYNAAIKIFLAEQAEKYGDLPNGRIEEWVDLAGLLAPKSEVGHFLGQLTTERNLTIAKVGKMITSLHSCYDTWSKEWSGAIARREFGQDITTDELVRQGATAKIWLYKEVLNDAAKEFSPVATVGFAKDSEKEIDILTDIEQVRGNLEDNSLVCNILEEILNLETKI